MIILQFLAVLLLIPLSLLLVLLFNIYLINWFYFLFVAFFALIYALLCGLVILNTSAVFWIFVCLIIGYVIRIRYLAQKIYPAANKRYYPLLYGTIKSKNYKLRLKLIFSFSFLNIFKLLPNAVNQKITKKTGLSIEITQLIDLILLHSRGTRIEIISKEADINFEIK